MACQRDTVEVLKPVNNIQAAAHKGANLKAKALLSYLGNFR